MNSIKQIDGKIYQEIDPKAILIDLIQQKQDLVIKIDRDTKTLEDEQAQSDALDIQIAAVQAVIPKE